LGADTPEKMGCLKLTYRTDRAALKAVQGGLPRNGGTCAGSYRYGFNTQEKEDEISGSSGTHYSAEFWMYDTRTARRWNLDPVYKHHLSNSTFGDNVTI
jgi:hypothetical protein